MGKRAALAAAGWGIAPIFVGEQTIAPGSTHPSGPKGTTDGNATAGLLAADGFVAGTTVYLDIEDGSAPPPLMKDYVRSWATAVAGQGYQTGIYCSHIQAAYFHQLVPSARIWAWKVSTTEPHPFPGTNFPTLDPAGCGYPGAFAWQLGQECQINLPGAPHNMLQVDLNVAVSPDPGQLMPAPPALLGV
jgi:hypothetical protein